MTYLEIFGAANNADFQNRCKVAMWRAAQDICSEPEETENHATRKEWAERVLKDVVTIKPHVLAMQVLRNPVIADDSTSATDDAIQFQVNSVVDAIIAIG